MLKVNEIFYSIQGEGPYAGWPAVFIRLSGCNLACDFCDTQHEDHTMYFDAEAAEAIFIHAKDLTKLVVITGGEPFAQDLYCLIKCLVNRGFKVQIESNGTIAPEGNFPWDFIDLVISPKPGNLPLPSMLAHASAVKFVLREGEEPDTSKVLVGTPIYLQPVDDKNEIRNWENLQWCVKLCLEHGYRLSLQTQKIIDVR